MINFLDNVVEPINSSFISFSALGMLVAFVITFVIGMTVILVIKAIKKN